MLTKTEQFDRAWKQVEKNLKGACYKWNIVATESEDIIAEVRIRAWRNFATFDERASFRTWVTIS